MVLGYFKKFFSIFGENKKSFYVYLCLSVVVGIMEMCGVALIYPFVLKILNQENSATLIDSPIFIGLVIIFIFLVKNVFMVFYTYLQAKFTKQIESEVNFKFIEYFLSAPFKYTSTIPVSKKMNILNFLIPNTINNFILRISNISVNIFIFTLIVAILAIKFPYATFLTTMSAIMLIIVQNKFFKPILNNIAEKQSKASTDASQRSNDILLNIKNIKILNNEIFFFEKYKSAISGLYCITKKTQFLNSVPPYVIEPFVIILLFILLGIITIQNHSEPDKLIASFALVASALFRLSPTIARLQVNLNGINSAIPSVNELLNFAENLDITSIELPKKEDYYKLKSGIELKNVNFEYQVDKPVLKDINLYIKKGEFIGIAGESGEGKTTLADVISGIFEPYSGEILVDGKPVHKLSHLNIGYIPQEFMIINSTIRENVAFGHKEINDERVVYALKQAQLYSFIEENYKEGIYANPFVDSTGISQGQKQRLSIARALYSNPDILILDEATSSLDIKTENEFCNILQALKGSITIIAIAHRLSTIKSADRVVFMKKHTISAIGKFEELYQANNEFKLMVEMSKLPK